jgi:hypothetical protein
MNLIFKTLEKAGMKINGPKYIFHAKKIKFLSYIVNLDRIKINPKKVQAVQD